MKIEVETFYEVCKIADLPIMRTERIIMDAVEGDLEKFLRVCEDYDIPITKNEMWFLNNTPTSEDDNVTAIRKTSKMVERAKELVRRHHVGV